MARLAIVISIMFMAQASYSSSGTKTCADKKMFLRDVCKSQKLVGETSHFSQCANGYSYEISTDGKNVDHDFVTTEIQCKMVEIRNQDGIERRTAYFDNTNKKVVVYQHDNGLSNAYVYGHTGYYHITQFASGDAIFNFHSFDN